MDAPPTFTELRERARPPFFESLSPFNLTVYIFLSAAYVSRKAKKDKASRVFVAAAAAAVAAAAAAAVIAAE
ncbi:hypothetical protein HZH68_009809 [Vespula germanica]|uniref:Uncharacterized protein n=1 Tax=Vespula germanica TaxID=30212 RepID=A0A834JZB0_VESGE|nr:hypothetical protein HZH68_009809 [Vespula germanica]